MSRTLNFKLLIYTRLELTQILLKIVKPRQIVLKLIFEHSDPIKTQKIRLDS